MGFALVFNDVRRENVSPDNRNIVTQLVCRQITSLLKMKTEKLN